MKPKKRQKLWLPYAVAVFGTGFSCFMWYFFSHHLEFYLELVVAFKYHLPWIALLTGLLLTLLISTIIRTTQLARNRAHTLNIRNKELKKEIGERVQAEESKQKLEVALLQGQKLQAIGTLAGGIAHDFNNLLYAIIGYTEISQQDMPKDSLTYQNLGKVLDASHRGRDLISRILAFSRRQHHEFDPIDLRTTIEAALDLLRPTIPTSVTINFNPTVTPQILGNQTQIHQILVNLITNAVDAMDGEGTINITFTHIPANDPLLRQFPETLQQSYCKIMISDTGHGMDQQTMERIFEPFYTTKEVGKGTGLGLSIVHSIIKEHQGEITVTSQLGRGTTFMILLPEVSA